MRIYHYFLLSSLTILTASCTNTSTTGPTVEVDALTIQLNRDGDGDHFDLHGLPNALAQSLAETEWAAVFQISVEGAAQPMLGSYTIEPSIVRFTPAFPLMAGQAYEAAFYPAELISRVPESEPAFADQTSISERFELPDLVATATSVTAIYPTAHELPANMLRFYVYFSAPMREGDALQHVSLLDENGQAVDGVFFDPIFELWDPSRERLTLLFDPGRVKTGLRAHEDLGRALVPGQSYTLRIEGSMLDGNNAPLDFGYEKVFQVIEPDLNPPDVDQWAVTLPASNTKIPMIIRFPAPLDHQLLTEFVQIRTAEGERVQGEIELAQQESEWRFVPNGDWDSGAYELWVNTKLEDLAGNNLHGLFDTPPEERLLHLDQSEIKLSFQIE